MAVRPSDLLQLAFYRKLEFFGSDICGWGLRVEVGVSVWRGETGFGIRFGARTSL